ncbi:MAG: class I SAM-dependent methyltransferase [Longimicrobiales bacterium]
METELTSGDYQHIADLYDHVTLYAQRRDIEFYVDAARAVGGPVLEVGCGTGRVLLPTARAGIEITGLDASPHMLEECRTRLQQESAEVRARVRLVQADMRDFQLEQRFRLVTIPFRPFQHLARVADQIACLHSLHRHLVPDGKLVFDLFNPWLEALVRDDLGQEVGTEPEFVTSNGRRVIRSHRTIARDLANQVNQVELIYDITHPDGRRERVVHAFAMRYLFRFEIEHLLQRCGFQVEQIDADYEGAPYGSKYPGDLVVQARRV